LKKVSPQHFTRLTKSIFSLIIIVCGISIIFVFAPEFSTIKQYKNVLKTENKKQEKKTRETQQISKNIDTIIDINTANLKEFISIGLSKRQAYSILNYRKAGGIFHKENDIIKIYTIDSIAYLNIRDKIYCKTPTINKKIKSDKIEEKPKNIELNSADTTSLKTIKGIGSFRAQKIIEYGKRLGGYYQKQQLLEVYTIDSIAYSQIKELVYTDTTLISKINLNTVNFKELLKHPYVDYYIAKNIFSYLKIQGNIRRIEELRENNILSDEEFEKLRRYIATF